MTATPTTTTAPATSDANQRRALGVALTLPLTFSAIFGACILLQPAPAATPVSAWAVAADRLDVEPIEIGSGELAFRTSCAVCHGPEGDGIPRLGKPLHNSEYVQTHTDAELRALIRNGRAANDPANTTGTLMPARGTPPLSDERIDQVLVYLRAIQEPNAPFASLDAWIVEQAADDATAAGVIVDAPGRELFVASCSACHGASGEGMEGLGLPLATSEFAAGMTDDDLIRFIKTGRPIWDAENQTGLDMPSKGGNPALSDDDLQTIVAYIRALHEQAEPE
ncbi:MAG: c-type cytochrome [Phycisphaerales bacterium]